MRVTSSIYRPAVLQGGTCEKGSEAGLGWGLREGPAGGLFDEGRAQGAELLAPQMLGL